MVEILKEGFEVLAEYAERTGKPDAAARLRARLEEDMRFVEEEGFAHVMYRSLAELRDSFRSNHLAAVAKEALRVSEDRSEFVHTSAPSVARALRKRMKEGETWFIPDYKDSTLRAHVYHSGSEMLQVVDRAFGLGFRGSIDKILVSVIGSQEIRRNLSEAWLETLDYAAEILPADTTVGELEYLLRDLTLYKERSIEKRLERVRASHRR